MTAAEVSPQGAAKVANSTEVLTAAIQEKAND